MGNQHAGESEDGWEDRLEKREDDHDGDTCDNLGIQHRNLVEEIHHLSGFLIERNDADGGKKSCDRRKERRPERDKKGIENGRIELAIGEDFLIVLKGEPTPAQWRDGIGRLVERLVDDDEDGDIHDGEDKKDKYDLEESNEVSFPWAFF